MIEGKNPLAAFHRSAGRCHGVLGTTQPPTLKILRSAWNAFARLLDLKFSENFQCPVCGCSPETIICDGTLVGIRKDLLPALLQELDQESLPITHGSKQSDRVFLHSVKGRELLMKYSAAYEVQWLFQGSEGSEGSEGGYLLPNHYLAYVFS